MGAAVLLGSLRSGRQPRLGLVIVLVGAAIVVYNDPTHTSGDLVFTPVLFAVGWLVGFALRERNRAGRGRRGAGRSRRAGARVGGPGGRGRGARPDGPRAARRRRPRGERDGPPGRRGAAPACPRRRRRSEALRNVEQAGRTALAEMRRLLGALRQGDDLLELTPRPGLDDLETLAGDVRAAGLDVRLHVRRRAGRPAALPRPLGVPHRPGGAHQRPQALRRHAGPT